MPKSKRNPIVLGIVLVALCLTGCGNRMPANAPVDDTSADSSASSAPIADPGASTPVTAPVAVTPATPAPVTGSLVVTNVAKTMSGIIFFKTMTVTGSVINTSNVPLSGVLTVNFQKTSGVFTKTLKTTSTQTQQISTLQPGQSLPFTIKAGEHEDDDADITVTSTPVAGATTTTAAAPAAAQPASSY